MPLINYKVELRLTLTNHCVLSAVCADNGNSNSNYIFFTIKDTKLCVLENALSAKDNQKLSKVISKGCGTLVYWN